MALPDPSLVHWVPLEDQPFYPSGSDVFRLYDPVGQHLIAWLPGEHIPCWLDFLPNRDTQAAYRLRRGNSEAIPVPAGPLRQKIREMMWGLVP